MSTKVRLRSRPAPHDLPPIATDDELLAWSKALVAPARPSRRRLAPLYGKPVKPSPPEPTIGDAHLGDDELFAEIYERALAVSSPTQVAPD